LLQLAFIHAGVMLGDGWYAQRSIAVGPPSLLMMLRLHLALSNGSSVVVSVVSDLDWVQSIGPVVYSDIYNGFVFISVLVCSCFTGEVYDARLAIDGWTLPDFDASNWTSVASAPAPSDHVVLSSHAIMPHVQVDLSYSPLQMWESSPGRYVFDFGQNMV
jgi:alpha-L-rhamnosidase